jgi:hypothetical protein
MFGKKVQNLLQLLRQGKKIIKDPFRKGSTIKNSQVSSEDKS